jgi:hypothetical protein
MWSFFDCVWMGGDGSAKCTPAIATGSGAEAHYEQRLFTGLKARAPSEKIKTPGFLY